MGNIVAPSEPARLLPEWDNAELNPNIIEALKRFGDAQAIYAHALRNIESQYLKALDLSDVNSAQQAEAVRALMNLA